MRDQILAQIQDLQRQKDEFTLVANARAEEQINALKSSLEMQISLRIIAYEQRIADLTALLGDPPS